MKELSEGMNGRTNMRSFGGTVDTIWAFISMQRNTVVGNNDHFQCPALARSDWPACINTRSFVPFVSAPCSFFPFPSSSSSFLTPLTLHPIHYGNRNATVISPSSTRSWATSLHLWMQPRRILNLIICSSLASPLSLTLLPPPTPLVFPLAVPLPGSLPPPSSPFYPLKIRIDS